MQFLSSYDCTLVSIRCTVKNNIVLTCFGRRFSHPGSLQFLLKVHIYNTIGIYNPEQDAIAEETGQHDQPGARAAIRRDRHGRLFPANLVLHSVRCVLVYGRAATDAQLGGWTVKLSPPQRAQSVKQRNVLQILTACHINNKYFKIHDIIRYSLFQYHVIVQR